MHVLWARWLRGFSCWLLSCASPGKLLRLLGQEIDEGHPEVLVLAVSAAARAVVLVLAGRLLVLLGAVVAASHNFDDCTIVQQADPT